MNFAMEFQSDSAILFLLITALLGTGVGFLTSWLIARRQKLFLKKLLDDGLVREERLVQEHGEQLNEARAREERLVEESTILSTQVTEHNSKIETLINQMDERDKQINLLQGASEKDSSLIESTLGQLKSASEATETERSHRLEAEHRVQELEVSLSRTHVLPLVSDWASHTVDRPEIKSLLMSRDSHPDVPPFMIARLASTRLMRVLGQNDEAIANLEACHLDQPKSETIALDLAETYLAVGRRAEAVDILAALPKPAKDDSWVERRNQIRRQLTPGIFICSLPKSGTVFLHLSLANGLEKPQLHMGGGGYFPTMAIPQTSTDIIRNQGAVYHIHADVTDYNIIEISNRLERMILLIRDPRGALLSWTHFIPIVLNTLDPVQRLHYGMPEKFAKWSFNKQLDWQIENYLPIFVKWVQMWLKAIDDGRVSIPVLIVIYEDMVRDQTAFFDKILDFHNIDRGLFSYPEQPSPGDANFRKGDPLEWQNSFTPKQLSKANKLIPKKLCRRFDWPS